mmetsp:Transcript_16181/g.39963  ORF Transcript_16181/g.39963 Transcript_16181/m.39963 type:complete len:201 (+) Transcript_16181:182-784(+)
MSTPHRENQILLPPHDASPGLLSFLSYPVPLPVLPHLFCVIRRLPTTSHHVLQQVLKTDDAYHRDPEFLLNLLDRARFPMIHHTFLSIQRYHHPLHDAALNPPEQGQRLANRRARGDHVVYDDHLFVLQIRPDQIPALAVVLFDFAIEGEVDVEGRNIFSIPLVTTTCLFSGECDARGRHERDALVGRAEQVVELERTVQ